MYKLMKSVIVILIILISSGCSETSFLDISIPENSVDQYEGHPYSSFSKQTSFSYSSEYPNIDMIKSIEGLLSEDWIRCSYGNDEWQDFADISAEKHKYIFQRIHVWKTEKNDRQIFITLRYEDPLTNKDVTKPLNNSQLVSVIESVRPWWLIWGNFNELCEN